MSLFLAVATVLVWCVIVCADSHCQRRGVFNKPSKLRWHSFCEWHSVSRLYRWWYFLVWWQFRKYPLCDPPYRSQIEGWTNDRWVCDCDKSKWRMWLKMHPNYQ